MAESYGSVLQLGLGFLAPRTFVGAGSTLAKWTTTLRVASVGAVFSVIGAATGRHAVLSHRAATGHVYA